MARLDRKTIVITGAAGNIGEASAYRFAQDGARLVLTDLESQTEKLSEIATAINASGGTALAVAADITDQDQIDHVISLATTKFSQLDGIFVNAGVIARSALDQRIDVDEDSWQASLNVNVTGTWRTIRAASRAFKDGTGGSIVVTSSIAGIRGGLNNAAYSATKHAVLGLVKTAAHELGPHGVRVNAVLPTGVRSQMFVRPERIAQARPDLANPTIDDAAELWKSTNLLGIEWIEPVDVANSVLFLLSDEARYLTGVSLPVDAGQSQLNPFIALENWLRPNA